MKKRKDNILLDDTIISFSRGDIGYWVNQPEKDENNPLIVPEYPWEKEVGIGHGSVIYDKEVSLYKMWYQSGREIPENKRTCWPITGHICYAESEDGIHWNKPDLGIIPFNGNNKNNIVLAPDCYADYPSVIVDEESDEERYKMLIFLGRGVKDRGLWLFTSPDGKKWVNRGKRAIFPCDDTSCLFKDPVSNKYIIYTKRHSPRRIRIYTESNDLISWSKTEPFLIPDGEDPWDVHLYFFVPQFLGELYVGYLGIYHTRPEKDNIDFQLTFSQDGKGWKRGGQRQTFLPTSNNPEDFDYGCLSIFNYPFCLEDKIILYYSGSQSKHETNLLGKTGIGRSILKKDRFVYVESLTVGQVVSNVFTLEYPMILYLNAKTEADGYIKTSLLTPEGKKIDDFSSAIYTGDEIYAQVNWRNKKVISGLPIDKFRISFELKKACLYAFYLREAK